MEGHRLVVRHLHLLVRHPQETLFASLVVLIL